MSILIKGMEMPTSCEECAFRVDESKTNVHDWTCPINQYPTFYCKKSQSAAESEEYLQDCPLIPISPHGRLIDKDALEYDISHGVVFSGKLHNPEIIGANKIINRIHHAPTIIEAEEV